MKATIRYTKIKATRHYTAGVVDRIMGTDEPLDDAIVRVAEITHCTPFAERDGPGTIIHLTNDKRIPTATPIDEIERRIEAAECRGDEAAVDHEIAERYSPTKN